MTPQEFIATIAEAAKASATKMKVPASFTIAEAALESGWGAHAPGFNLFGVKADTLWKGAITQQRTREFLSGKWIFVMAKFRAYADWEEGLEDHAEFLISNPRYEAAFAFQDGQSFARAVAAAGYATDPQYADKLISIITAHALGQYDTQEVHPTT